MNHALYGASIPFAIALVIYALRRGRASLTFLVLTPLAMAAMAFWASAPDLPRAIGMQDLYLRLSMDPRIDIFLWHYSIDQLETSTAWYSVFETESHWFVIAFALEAAALMAAALRELFREDRH